MQLNGLVDLPSSPAPVIADKNRGPDQSNKLKDVKPSGGANPGRIDDDALKSMVKDANQALLENHSELHFVIEGDPQRLVVKLVDTESQKVLRQFPSQEMMVVARNLDRLKSVAVHSVA